MMIRKCDFGVQETGFDAESIVNGCHKEYDNKVSHVRGNPESHDDYYTDSHDNCDITFDCDTDT